MNKYLLLITTSPHSAQAQTAIDFAHSKLSDGDDVRVFFYGDGAYTANRLMWQSADVPSIRDAWIALHTQHGIPLPVCVSTALARGVCDGDNARRHGLDGDNLQHPFTLVGLSELAMALDEDMTLLQF